MLRGPDIIKVIEINAMTVHLEVTGFYVTNFTSISLF